MLAALHVVSGDLWAGAEAQVGLLLDRFARGGDVRVSALLFNAGRLSERLAGAGVRVVVAPEDRHGVWALARAAAREIVETGADVIHSHGYKESVVAAAARAVASRGAAAPRPAHVRTQHSAPQPVTRGARLKARLYYAIDRAVLARATDRVIAVSDEIAGRLAPIAGRGTVRVVRNGVEPAGVDGARVASARAALGAGAGDVLIGAAGRLQRVKGFDVLIAAFGALGRDVPARLAILGDGPEGAALEREAARLPDPSRVRFAGHVEDFSSALAALDVLAVPSRHEGMPMVLLEAMALGLPIAAARVGGIPEAVVDDVSALLVPPEDPAALASALARLARDPALRARLGAAARARALSDFTAERMARETAAVYREAVAERCAAAGTSRGATDGAAGGAPRAEDEP